MASLKRKIIPFATCIALLLIALPSCTSTKKSITVSDFGKSNCYSQPDYTYSLAVLPLPIHTLQLDSSLTNNFSAASLNIANALELLSLLAKYTATQQFYVQFPSTSTRVELLDMAQTIHQKINTASLEVSSVTSEMDCEEERASQIANYLKNQISQREKKLLISSIIIGAAGAITAELLSMESSGNAGTYVAIGTSVAEAALGAMMLGSNHHIAYAHIRNTPAEIWNGPAVSKTLPPSIWYYLNYKNPSTTPLSLREQLVENWTKFGQIKTSRKKQTQPTETIYFGEGGDYSAEQLQNRADMYDQIESYISLMKQDLKQLSKEFGKFSERRSEK